jgi:LacI family transcriptional regulator
VTSDNCEGAKAATAHLLENGHRRIVCLQGLPGTSPNDDRLQGYRAAFADQQVDVEESLIVGDGFGQESGYIAMKLLLRAGRDFTAIFAFSNQIALGALRALAEAKLSVPGDVSIVCFDDQPFAAYLVAPMTSVAQRASEMGKIAVRMLFDQIRSPSRTIQGGILLPTDLVVRSSVRTISSQSQGVRRHVCG